MKIVLACDHGGFETAKNLKEYLLGRGYEVSDFIPKNFDGEDDYPDYIIPAMKNLQKSPDSFGVLLCRNGVGASLLANKFRGIRAALSFNKKHAQSARTDDNANVLAIPSDYLSDDDIREICLTFLETKFTGLERHLRRLKKVELEERENFK